MSATRPTNSEVMNWEMKDIHEFATKNGDP